MMKRFYSTQIARDVTEFFDVFFAVDDDQSENPVAMEQAALDAVKNAEHHTRVFRAESTYLAQGWRGFNEISPEVYKAFCNRHHLAHSTAEILGKYIGENKEGITPEPAITTYYKDGRVLISPVANASLDEALSMARDTMLRNDPIILRIEVRGFDTDGRFICHLVEEVPDDICFEDSEASL